MEKSISECLELIETTVHKRGLTIDELKLINKNSAELMKKDTLFGLHEYDDDRPNGMTVGLRYAGLIKAAESAEKAFGNTAFQIPDHVMKDAANLVEKGDLSGEDPSIGFVLLRVGGMTASIVVAGGHTPTAYAAAAAIFGASVGSFIWEVVTDARDDQALEGLKKEVKEFEKNGRGKAREITQEAPEQAAQQIPDLNPLEMRLDRLAQQHGNDPEKVPLMAVENAISRVPDAKKDEMLTEAVASSDPEVRAVMDRYLTDPTALKVEQEEQRLRVKVEASQSVEVAPPVIVLTPAEQAKLAALTAELEQQGVTAGSSEATPASRQSFAERVGSRADHAAELEEAPASSSRTMQL